MPETVAMPYGRVKVVAKIRKAFLGWEDHGIFTAWVDVNYGGTGQGVGFYSLDEPYEFDTQKGRRGTAYGLEWVMRFMRACGVREWNDLVGRTVYIVKEDEGWNSKVIGIEPLPTEEGEPFYFDNLTTEYGVSDA